MPDKKDKNHLDHIERWIDAEQFGELLEQLGTPQDASELLKVIQERKKQWDWNKGSKERLGVIWRWLLGLGAFAMAINALRVVSEWLKVYWGP